MRMIGIFIPMLFASALAGNAYGIDRCDLSKIGQQVSTQAIAIALSCDNSEAIAADVASFFDSFHLCEQRVELPQICPIIAAYVVNKAEEQIPSDWACQPKAAKALGGKLVAQGCEVLIGQFF